MIFNNIGCDKNIIKVEWTEKGSVTYWGNRKRWPVPHNDRWRIINMRRTDRDQVTDIQGGVVEGDEVGDPIDDCRRELTSDYWSHEPVHKDYATGAEGAGACC
jgi:hypothetical protein